MNTYTAQAVAVKARRQAAGKYKRPTQRQRRAFAHYLSGCVDSLTKQEIDALATHPYLLERQRTEFARMAATL